MKLPDTLQKKNRYRICNDMNLNFNFGGYF